MSFDNNLWLSKLSAATQRGETYDWFDHQRYLGNLDSSHNNGMLAAMSKDPAAEQAVRDATKINAPGYANSWGVNPGRDNPNGYTGVHSQQTGAGFSGNPEHFIFNYPTDNNAKVQTQASARPSHQPVMPSHQPVMPSHQPSSKPSNQPPPNARPNPNYMGDDGFTFGGESTVTDEDNPTVTGADGTGPGGQQQPNVPFVPADSPLTYGGKADATPFLDAYMRAQQRAAAPGPVTSTMKKYLED